MIAKRALSLAVASAAVAWGGFAQAATFNLNLSGALADYVVEPSFDCCGFHVAPSFLPLTGLDGTDSITVNQGDVFTVTVTLDGSLTIPASVSRTDVTLLLTGSAFPSENTGLENEVVDFTNLGSEVLHISGESTTTSSQLAVFNPLFPPDNGPLTFDQIVYSFDIQTLGQSATLDGASLNFDRLAATAGVPEPASWALMLLGFGGLGVTLRSLRRRAFA